MASSKKGCIGAIGGGVTLFVLFLMVSVSRGGHMAGPTHIAPGNVGLVIDNYQGTVEKDLMSAGVHWQGAWETVHEIPTAQRTLGFEHSAEAKGNGAVQVNTATNMLGVDVTAQYRIRGDRARDLYNAYQDQFADIERFEETNLRPSIKGAINSAIGDQDTAYAVTTEGKTKAEVTALKILNDEWEPRGIAFENLLIRGIDQDEESKKLLSTTLQKQQDIDNTKLALQQQKIDNATILQKANADAQINRLQDSTLTDLYIQDKMLGRVKTLYVPSEELMGLFKSK